MVQNKTLEESSQELEKDASALTKKVNDHDGQIKKIYEKLNEKPPPSKPVPAP